MRPITFIVLGVLVYGLVAFFVLRVTSPLMNENADAQVRRVILQMKKEGLFDPPMQQLSPPATLHSFDWKPQEKPNIIKCEVICK